jgi:hypothetical protein
MVKKVLRFHGDVVATDGHVQSTPAENAFVTAEERTTTRTVESLAMLSKAAPYSRQNLFRLQCRVNVNHQGMVKLHSRFLTRH